ncbi:hypothetical protein C8R44DRAFT_892030 [Mycena epipterygia]|nr:hypothetical protein C8R44DRAFT_892030 [Mycena epipterygia]
MSPQEIQHLNILTSQTPLAGPSNTTLPGAHPNQKRKASAEPEGSDAKRMNKSKEKEKDEQSDSNTESSKGDSSNVRPP